MNRWGVVVSWVSCLPVAWVLLTDVNRAPQWWHSIVMLGAGFLWFIGILMILILPAAKVPQKGKRGKA